MKNKMKMIGMVGLCLLLICFFCISAMAQADDLLQETEQETGEAETSGQPAEKEADDWVPVTIVAIFVVGSVVAVVIIYFVNRNKRGGESSSSSEPVQMVDEKDGQSSKSSEVNEEQLSETNEERSSVEEEKQE